jgi:prepilin-type N-terminal cleavage/methylation domain-containing protein
MTVLPSFSPYPSTRDESMKHYPAEVPANQARLSGDQRGFTAVEIAMVATVIAIFALIALPIFRNRVEEAKLSAAQADLTSLMKAEILAKADTGFYLRLEDLDNTENNVPNNPPTGIIYETPAFAYPAGSASLRQSLTLAQIQQLAGPASAPKLRGPYISFQRFTTYGEIQASTLASLVLQSQTGDRLSPIQDIPLAQAQGAGLYDSNQNRIPVDPWGNPYLFFPSTGETGYSNSAIYSMGPNGVPGDGSLAGFGAYIRPASGTLLPGNLGSDDDMQVQF